MATFISDFRDPIRAYLLDTHPTIKQFSADQIDSAVKLVVNLGKAPGITATIDSLNPDVTPTDPDPVIRQSWALIVLHAAKRFIVPHAAAASYRTRAVSESFGESKELVFELITEVNELEFGAKGE